MIVLLLFGAPAGLRGEVTRWLLEIGPGVFVGHLSVRVRENLWVRVVEDIGQGRATMVFSARGEQRLSFLTYGEVWEPTDFDGIRLVRRGNGGVVNNVREDEGSSHRRSEGWSIAGRRRQFLSSIERRAREQLNETNWRLAGYDPNEEC